ncbi:phage tail tape measure protein [Radiobacillus kanasensis]|uniref:phage tail tape measure protein n=1 Tax=Radiobacillus kanasensis TaxID=2844358 RepID=UPI001E53F0C9|nr:phage tail tape measure protein [Radiobacillus kanasensis]UFT98085.1 phage tail tape measure protein [Radiobacillus kanasensis]
MDRDVIADLVAQVSLDGTKFQQGAGKINRGLKLMQEEMKTAQQRTKLFGESTDNLKNKSQILGNQLKLQKTSVELLDKAYKEAVASGGAYSKTAQNLAVRLERAQRSMMATEKQMSDVNREIVEQNGLLVTNQGLWSRSFSRLKESINENVKGLNNLQTAMGGALIGAGVGFGAAVYSAATFEQALADVKAISGAAGDEMSRLGELAKDLGESTRYSGKQVLEGAQELIKAGVPLEKVLGGALKSSLDLATAGQLELAESAQIASTALNAFEQDNLTVADAANILAGAANASATDVHEMQIGLAQSAAVASASGLTFEETATALATLAQSGLRGSDAGTSLRTMLLRLVPETNKAKDAMKELGLMTEDGSNNFFDAKGELKDFDEIVQILHDSLKDLSPEERSAELKTLFGQDAYRAGAIFFKEAADGVNEMNEAMKATTAADVAATRMDTFLGKLEELKSTLATLGIEVADDEMAALSDTVKELTDWVRDLDPDMVALGLKAVGAAAGFGLMATTLVKVSRGLMLLSANPVGLTITGLSLLVGAFVGLNGVMEEQNKISLEAIQKKQEEVKATDDLITRFDKLKRQNKLSNDEMLRFLDIQAELQKTTTPQKIEELTKEQAELLEKSGFTNEEMQEFLKLNDKVIEKAPATAKAISKEGEAYAANTDALKKMNDEKRKQLESETRLEVLDILEQQKKKQEEINALIDERGEIEKDIKENIKLQNENELQQVKQNKIIKDLKDEIAGAEGVKKKLLETQLLTEQDKLTEMKLQEGILEKQIDKLKTKFEENGKNLETSRKELAKMEAVAFKYEQIVLSQVGLNSEKGKGIEKINETIQSLEKQKAKNTELMSQGKISISQQQERNKELDQQIAKLESSKTKLEEINARAREDINKNIYLSETPDNYWEELDSKLSSPVRKNVELRLDYIEPRVNNPYKQKQFMRGLGFPGYAEGTDFHPGGPALVGEEGFELAKWNNQWAFLDGGIKDLPIGTQVFTHEESMKLLSAINRIPAYAEGVSRSGEADRIISRLQGSQPSNMQGNATLYVNLINNVDGREFSRHTYKTIAEFIERDKEERDQFK